MVKSEFANRLDKVQGVIYRSLKEIGYRKQGRTYNNALDSSLVHVINFQMGQYPVGNQEETPFRKNLYGYFSVNLGVFVPKVYLLTSRSQEIPQFIRVGHCEVRKRLGDLMTPSKDVWWNLVGDSKELSVTILGLLKEDGLPYLERFRSNEDVVREWERFGQSIGLPPRAALSIAIIYADQGKFAKAEDLLQQEYESAKHESYAKFVSEIAQKVGVSFPNDFEA